MNDSCHILPHARVCVIPLCSFLFLCKKKPSFIPNVLRQTEETERTDGSEDRMDGGMETRGPVSLLHFLFLPIIFNVAQPFCLPSLPLSQYHKRVIFPPAACISIYLSVNFSAVRSAIGMKVNNFQRMKLKGQRFSFSQSLSRCSSTGGIVAFCKEAVKVIFHVLTASGVISIQTTESSQGLGYQCKKNLQSIFICPPKNTKGVCNIFPNPDEVGQCVSTSDTQLYLQTSLLKIPSFSPNLWCHGNILCVQPALAFKIIGPFVPKQSHLSQELFT